MTERPRHEVAEIFERFLRGHAGNSDYTWSWEQRAVIDSVLACRTARLGGHVDTCDACGHREISYNSCRNRHCPKCQGSAQTAWLEEVFGQGRLELYGRLSRYRSRTAFERLLHEACRNDWVVYAKPPFDGPEHVLAYLARYTHRVAISNHRLLHVDDERVTFRFKDYRSRRSRSTTLPLAEFARRFLLHVLPKGFVRVRYYGFLANGSRARLLAACRAALDQPVVHGGPSPEHAEGLEIFLDLLPTGLRLCPHCKRGVLRCVQILERPPPHRRPRDVAA